MCGMMGICLASPWPLLKLLLIVEKVVGLSMSGVWSLLEWYVPGHAMCVQSVGMLHCKWTVRVVQDRDASLCSMPARHCPLRGIFLNSALQGNVPPLALHMRPEIVA
jgi:hypothetical protein